MTKEHLRAYRANVLEAVQLREQLERVRSRLRSARTSIPTGMPGGGRGDLITHHLDLEALYERRMAELAAEQLLIEQAIARLEPRQRLLLRYRYIQGLPWEAICTKMSYSWRQIHRLHGDALAALAEEP